MIKVWGKERNTVTKFCQQRVLASAMGNKFYFPVNFFLFLCTVKTVSNVYSFRILHYLLDFKGQYYFPNKNIKLLQLQKCVIGIQLVYLSFLNETV